MAMNSKWDKSSGMWGAETVDHCWLVNYFSPCLFHLQDKTPCYKAKGRKHANNQLHCLHNPASVHLILRGKLQLWFLLFDTISQISSALFPWTILNSKDYLTCRNGLYLYPGDTVETDTGRRLQKDTFIDYHECDCSWHTEMCLLRQWILYPVRWKNKYIVYTQMLNAPLSTGPTNNWVFNYWFFFIKDREKNYKCIIFIYLRIWFESLIILNHFFFQSTRVKVSPLKVLKSLQWIKKKAQFLPLHKHFSSLLKLSSWGMLNFEEK